MLPKPNYDYILIDCRPSLGMLTLNALTAADSVVIPVQAQYLPARAMTQLLRTVSKVKAHTNPNLAIEKLYDRFYTKRGNEIAKERQKTAVTFYNDMLKEVSDSYDRGIEMLKKAIGEV